MLDRVLVLTLFPLWLVRFGLQLDVGLQGGFIHSDLDRVFEPTTDASSYPTFLSEADPQ